MSEPLTNPQIRKLKALGQRLEPMLKVGKAGLSDGFIATVNESLSLHELVKVKFTEFKEDKKQLAPELAARTSSHLIHRVGHVVVLYRPQPDPEKRKIKFDYSKAGVARVKLTHHRSLNTKDCGKSV